MNKDKYVCKQNKKELKNRLKAYIIVMGMGFYTIKFKLLSAEKV